MIPLDKISNLLKDSTVQSLLGRWLMALFLKVGAAGLSFVLFVLVSNILTPLEYGRFAIGFSLAIALATVCGLGLGTAILRFHTEYTTKQQFAFDAGFLRFSFLASVIAPFAVAVVGAIVLLVSKWISPSFETSYLYASLVLMVIMTIGEYAACALRAFGYTFMSMAPRDVIWRVISCAIVVYFAWRGIVSGATMVLLWLAIVFAMVLIWQFIYAKSHFAAAFSASRKQYDFPLWRAAALPMLGATTLYAFVQQFDIVVVGYFLSAEDSASYFSALRTATVLSLLLIAGNLISAPLISKYFHGGDRDGLARVVKILSVGISLPTLFGYALLVVFGKQLLALFHPSYVSAYPQLLILGAGFTFDAIAGPTAYVLQMVGKERDYLKIMGSCYLITLLLQCVLAPTQGAVGVAAANALGLIAANILIVAKVRRELGIDPSLLGLFLKVKEVPLA